VVREKLFESPLIEYRMNGCGHRAGVECGPKAPGTYRVVLLGSSIAEGVRVSREQSFAALLPAVLSRDTGRKVEIYNEAQEWSTPHNIDLHFQEALAAQPDLLVWPLSYWDVDYASFTVPYSPNRNSEGKLVNGPPPGIWQRMVMAFQKKTFTSVVGDAWKQLMTKTDRTRTVQVMMHMIYLNPDLYIDRYLNRGADADFLRENPGPVWRDHIQQFEHYVADVEAKAKTANVPIVIVYVPQRAQAAMISRGQWPAGVDPYTTGNDIGPIVERHGGIFVDLSPDFRSFSHSERYYYPADEHPTPEGHAVLTALLADRLTSGVVPELRAVSTQKEAARKNQ
jgi:hypothetical protein